jgi:hypothetical protein
MMTEIDEQFKTTAEQINAKLKEATTALREANKLADAAGLPALAYTQWVGEEDSTMDKLSDEERQALDEDEEWDGESTPLKMKIDMLNTSDLEREISIAGWSTSSSYC